MAGWDLPLLQRVVDQFVIHFDAAGTSKRCFEVLHDRRGLSVHFLLDLDGTIYQTLDVKESAWHATVANGRSVGVEVANIGAYPVQGPDPLALLVSAGFIGQGLDCRSGSEWASLSPASCARAGTSSSWGRSRANN